MNRTPDLTMDLMLSAAARFSAIADLPRSLKGAREGEAEDKLLALLAQIAERLVAHAYDVLIAHGSDADLLFFY